MIGIDIIDKRRIARLWDKNGLTFAKKVLHTQELEQLKIEKNPVRFLSMRWAAKEALSKALKTGLRSPVVMPAFFVKKNKDGSPFFHFSPEIENILQKQKVKDIHLSLSDERDYAIAVVMFEKSSL